MTTIADMTDSHCIDCTDGAIFIQYDNHRWPSLGERRHCWLKVPYQWVGSWSDQLWEWWKLLSRAGVVCTLADGMLVPQCVANNGSMIAGHVRRVGITLRGQPLDVGRTGFVVGMARRGPSMTTGFVLDASALPAPPSRKVGAPPSAAGRNNERRTGDRTADPAAPWCRAAFPQPRRCDCTAVASCQDRHRRLR